MRSPVRYGKKISPSLPGGIRAASRVTASYGSFGYSVSRSQRKLPPDESCTPITCQELGPAAWQKVCTRIRASTAGVSAYANTTPLVPITLETIPGSTIPQPTAPAA